MLNRLHSACEGVGFKGGSITDARNMMIDADTDTDDDGDDDDDSKIAFLIT